MPLLTVRAIDTHKPKAEPYKLTLDRGLQLRIAPDGARTLLVRYTVKGSDGERQHRLPREYGEGPGQIKLAAACAEAARIRALARGGVDWPAQEEARLRAETATRELAEREEGVTLAKALREYVLVSGGVLKRMLNHAAGGDVTLGHYVGKSETQLRAGWQTVADFVEAAAAPAQSPVQTRRVSALSSAPARRRASQKVTVRAARESAHG